MKRILFFLLLLVNLQLTTDNGSLSIEFGEVSAQRVKEEQITNTASMGGVSYCRWKGCKQSFPDCDPYALETHEMSCIYRMLNCPTCGAQYQVRNGHTCVEYQSALDELIVTGQRDGRYYSSVADDLPDPSYFYNNRDDDGNNGGNYYFGTSQREPKFEHMSLKELREKEGVKLLGNKKSTKASKKLNDLLNLHPQFIRGECVARAFAFIVELNGGNFNKVLNKLYDKILKVGGISRWDDDGCITLFQKDINIIKYGNDFETVANLIDNGIPVACSANDYPFHMEVIIGYDDKNYYVAAGNRDGDVSVVNKNAVNCNYVYGIK